MQIAPTLSKSAKEILSDILSQTSETEPSPGVDSVFYRARNHDSRPTLDALQREGFLVHKDHSKYLLSLKSLFVLRNGKSTEILSISSQIFIALQILYKQEPKKGVLVTELSTRLQRSTSEIIKALVYLRDAPIWGSYSTDLTSQGATIQAGESILNYIDLNSVFIKLWEQHLRSYPEFNSLIFISGTSSDRTSSTSLGISINPIGLSDAPAAIECDTLGYQVYVNAIVDLLTHRNTKAPFSLAISGPWGSGKTTLLRWIKQSLEQKHYPTVWFSSWNCNQQEEVWASFAKAIIESQIFSLWSEIQLRYRRFKDSLPKKSVRLTWLVIALGISTLTGFFYLISADIFFISILAILGTGSILLPYIDPAWKALRSPLLKLVGSTKGPDYDRVLGFQKEFKDDLSRLISFTTSEKPLFIFVDDLDRAPPPVPVKLLEAMNILIGQERCIFIVGLDIALVSASVEARYLPVIERLHSSAKRFTGRDFIEKLVQLEFALPAMTDHQLKSFLDGRLKSSAEISPFVSPSAQNLRAPNEIVKAENNPLSGGGVNTEPVFREESDQFINSIHLFSKCLPRNPRKVIRYINSYRLLAHIAERRGLFSANKIDLDVLGAVTVIATEYPEIYRLLGQDNYKSILSDIHRWVNGGDRHQGYNLTGEKERYEPLRDLFSILIGSTIDIKDYLSLSAVIDPDTTMSASVSSEQVTK